MRQIPQPRYAPLYFDLGVTSSLFRRVIDFPQSPESLILLRLNSSELKESEGLGWWLDDLVTTWSEHFPSAAKNMRQVVKIWTYIQL